MALPSFSNQTSSTAAASVSAATGAKNIGAPGNPILQKVGETALILAAVFAALHFLHKHKG